MRWDTRHGMTLRQPRTLGIGANKGGKTLGFAGVYGLLRTSFSAQIPLMGVMTSQKSRICSVKKGFFKGCFQPWRVVESWWLE
jgi:hypothetical protein